MTVGAHVLLSAGDISVLIVDDNRQMRTLLRHMLSASGMRKLAEADSVERALARIRGQTFHLILLDWEMPPVGGLAFVQAIRGGNDNPCIPIVMLTAHTECTRVAAARDAGVNGYLKKPISPHLLFARVTSALTDRRLFVRTGDYFGPDRRHGLGAAYGGPLRRASDRRQAETLDLDDERWCA